eukprot:IDg1739t1
MSTSSSSADEDCALAAVISATEGRIISSDDVGWRGRSQGSRANISRGECSWWRDYLCPNSIYTAAQFRRRFRIPLKLFRKLEQDLPVEEPMLRQRVDALGRRGAATWQKILMCLRRLGDGTSFSSLDDQARMSIETMRQCFIAFNKAMRLTYASTNNDITVCENSPLLLSILQGDRRMRLSEGYKLGGVQRNWDLYFLTDGIYPRWSIFLKPNQAPVTQKQTVFNKAQEGRRKDVERLFGALQGRFKIMRHEFYGWRDGEIVDIVNTCTILHNMLVRLRLRGELDDEMDENGNALDSFAVVNEFSIDIGVQNQGAEILLNTQELDTSFGISRLEHLLGIGQAIRDGDAHRKLLHAVEDHIWSHVGHSLHDCD